MKYIAIVGFFLWVLAELLTAEPGQVDALPNRLVDAAEFRTTLEIRYDPAYVVLEYPGGDVPADTGVCTDVVIRSYRAAFGVDLQERVHEDMRAAFSSYPNLWGLRRPDRNIDHRRVPNLQRYLERQGAEIEEGEFQPGDLIAWDLTGNGLWHIGIVVGRDEFVHNIGAGPVRERGIRQWEIVGHYRWFPEPKEG